MQLNPQRMESPPVESNFRLKRASLQRVRPCPQYRRYHSMLFVNKMSLVTVWPWRYRKNPFHWAYFPAGALLSRHSSAKHRFGAADRGLPEVLQFDPVIFGVGIQLRFKSNWNSLLLPFRFCSSMFDFKRGRHRGQRVQLVGCHEMLHRARPLLPCAR